MIERPIWFGPEPGMLGVLSSPDDPAPERPAVLLLNAGLLHRVGPNRLNVDLARRLAAAGFHAFRFDLSGIGDSELGDGVVGIDRARGDVRAAMDEAHRTTGATHFVLVGLCTGAFNAFRTALVDERVVACVLIDGYGYPTVRSLLRHYRSKVFEWERWVGWLQRRLSPRHVADEPEDLVVYENETVPKDRFRDELAALVARDVALLMVYTEFGPLPVNYPGQLADALPDVDFGDGVTESWYPQTDHTFSLPGNRWRLVDEIEAWVEGVTKGAAVGGEGRA